jgi:hypothetical protein
MKKDKKNMEKRSFSKRFELNELEAKTLRMKSDQCGLSEADYIRELIMNSQPVEAPPRQFYEQMEKVNRIASTIQRICATAECKEDISELRSLYVQLIGHIVEIKECVSKARFFAIGSYQNWEHQVELAKKEGRIPPPLEAFVPRDKSRDIKDPATDPDLGWNALGIRPPFLEECMEQDSQSENESMEDDGWQSADEPTQSIDSYADTNVFSPPKKGDDP